MKPTHTPAKQRWTVDQRDFEEAMTQGSGKSLRYLIGSKFNAGMDPRDVATLLEYHARCAREWCAGRYGSF